MRKNKTNRRGKGEGHIEKITLRSGKKAYRGWLTVGYRANRTPIRRTVQRSTRAAVVEGIEYLRKKYKIDIDLAAEAEMLLSTLFTKWLDHYTVTDEPPIRTIETYQWAIKNVLDSFGDPLVAQVTALQLQELLISLRSKFGPSSLSLLRVALKGAFGQAVLWRIIFENPAQHLKIPRKHNDSLPEQRHTLAADKVQRYLQALQQERLGLAAALTYALGIRPGEAAALRICDIDLDAGTLKIEASHSRSETMKTIVRGEPKTRRGHRTLPIPPALIPWIHQHLARMQNERQAMGERWTEPDEGLLFVNVKKGGRINSGPIYQVTRRVGERLELGTIGPRILRRSMLSALGKAGVDPKVRAAIGGHTAAITEKHYHEVDSDEIDTAMGYLTNILGTLDMPDDSRADEAAPAEADHASDDLSDILGAFATLNDSSDDEEDEL